MPNCLGDEGGRKGTITFKKDRIWLDAYKERERSRIVWASKKLSAGPPALVYRSMSKTSERPSEFIQNDGECVVVQSNLERRIFRSLAAKPMVCPKVHKRDEMNISCDGNLSIDRKVTERISLMGKSAH